MFANEIRRLVPECKVCGTGLAGHGAAQIACLPIHDGTQERVQEMFGHIQAHDWEKLRGLDEFIGNQDDAIAYAVGGPHPGGMVVLTRDFYELRWDAVTIVEEIVTADEMERIRSFTPAHRWRIL